MAGKRRPIERIVLAYSGGLGTSAAIRWLAEAYGAEIVTVTLDLGQGRVLTDVRDRALAIGASRAHVIDVREEFAGDFVLPALQAGAFDDVRDRLAPALGRLLVAKHLAAIARIEETTVVAHGARAREDCEQLDAALRSLDTGLETIAPATDWEMSQDDLVAYVKQRGIPIPSADGPCGVDANLWGRWLAPIDGQESSERPDDTYVLTKAPSEVPDAAAFVEIDFDRGVPAKINGVPMTFAELTQSLETIAGAHGVGRIDVVNRNPDGTMRHRTLEAPAAVVLQAAHRELQFVLTSREVRQLTAEMAAKYLAFALDGAWFSPAREAVTALVNSVQQAVTGSVRLKLDKGICQVGSIDTHRHSPVPHSAVAAPQR